jgi:hypothetical protein
MNFIAHVLMNSRDLLIAFYSINNLPMTICSRLSLEDKYHSFLITVWRLENEKE